jgi:hypothetical protein
MHDIIFFDQAVCISIHPFLNTKSPEEEKANPSFASLMGI